MSRPAPTTTTIPGFSPCIVSGTLSRDREGWGPTPSPGRMRERLSAALLSPVPLHSHPVDIPPMQRPAYLDHAALRRHLVVDPSATELSILEPTTRSSSASLSIVSDSDIDPREARGTPTPEPHNELTDAIRVPTRWNAGDKHQALVLSPDGREVRYPSPTHSTDKEAAAIRANHPMPAACGVYYFEVQIIEKGTQGHIGIGFSSREVGLNRLPGWEPMSWGYHGDDGNSFAGQSDGTPYGPVFGTGDVIGCGVDFTEGRAFYTKNGEFLSVLFRCFRPIYCTYTSLRGDTIGHPAKRRHRVPWGHEIRRFASPPVPPPIPPQPTVETSTHPSATLNRDKCLPIPPRDGRRYSTGRPPVLYDLQLTVDSCVEHDLYM